MMSFLYVGSVMLLGAISPGPDFLVVTKNAALAGRRAGILTACGVGCAILIHAGYSLAGLGLILQQSPFAFDAIRYGGAAYLAWLGTRLLLSRGTALPEAAGAQSAMTPGAAYAQGFLTNLLNPKAVIFFVTIFAQIVGPGIGWRQKIVFGLEAALITGGWFALLACLINIPRMRRLMAGSLRLVELILGVLLLGFAVRLVLERL
jgi:RhtB (resistance to homoserine/threonine) family protein